MASQETTKRFLGACDACHNNISGRNRLWPSVGLGYEEVPATEAGGSAGSNECVSADRDEEPSNVQVSDEEEHYERSERRFGYNPDNGEPWAEYQAVMGDDWFAW